MDLTLSGKWVGEFQQPAMPVNKIKVIAPILVMTPAVFCVASSIYLLTRNMWISILVSTITLLFALFRLNVKCFSEGVKLSLAFFGSLAFTITSQFFFIISFLLRRDLSNWSVISFFTSLFLVFSVIYFFPSSLDLNGVWRSRYRTIRRAEKKSQTAKAKEATAKEAKAPDTRF